MTVNQFMSTGEQRSRKKSGTELGAICARVLIVSSGWPTSTCAAPPTLPASSSFTICSSIVIHLVGPVVLVFLWGGVARDGVWSGPPEQSYGQNHES